VRFGLHKIRLRPRAIAALAGFACALNFFAFLQTRAQSQVRSTNGSADSSIDAANAALCPVVYPDDQTPSGRGYRYTFIGNAFFINEQGYLLTVAHVLETFRDGGQPYILVKHADTPPRLLKVTVIAKDAQHDVAILRATPNPFGGKYNVAFLPLDSAPAVRGEAVLALSLRPKSLQRTESFEYEREDTSPGTVLSYESTKLDNSGPAVDVFLLSHPVVQGQSGSPVLALKSRAAVGLVEGLWLRGVPLTSVKPAALPTNTPGAAVPIRYAIALLEEHGVTWRSAKPSPSEAAPATSSLSGAGKPNQ
jgi:S1-C subfamily serine protease